MKLKALIQKNTQEIAAAVLLSALVSVIIATSPEQAVSTAFNSPIIIDTESGYLG